MYPNDAGFLFSYKAQKWAYSELCNHFCNAVDEQKDNFRQISPYTHAKYMSPVVE